MSVRIMARLAVLAGVLLLISSSAEAGFRTLTWNASAGATGYRLHYGDAPGSYTTSIDVGNTTEKTLDEDLDDCTRWYFAVTAYNTVGESDFSTEVSWLTPVGLSQVTPDDPGQPVMQGVQIPMTIDGIGFSPDADLKVHHPGWVCPPQLDTTQCDTLMNNLEKTVRLENPSIACDSIQVLATIEPIASGSLAARDGAYTLTVTRPDGSTDSIPSAFEILQNPARYDINQTDEDTTGRLDGKDRVWIERIYQTCVELGTQPCENPQIPGYEIDYDFNGDGFIDGDDLANIVGQFGWCWNGNGWSQSACPAVP